MTRPTFSKLKVSAFDVCVCTGPAQVVLFRDNGKEHGNYRDYRDYKGLYGDHRIYIGSL